MKLVESNLDSEFIFEKESDPIGGEARRHEQLQYVEV